MSTQSVGQDLARVEGRPRAVPTGVRSVDERLGGGFQVGELTLVAHRPDCEGLDWVFGAVHRAVKRRNAAAVLTERRDEAELNARLVALAAQVDPFRAVAGLASAEDRLRMTAARRKVPWRRIAVLAGRAITPPEIDELVFSYRPLLVVGELRPRAPDASRPQRVDSYREGIERLASLARRHHVAMVLLHSLPEGAAAPRLGELPDRGRLSESASTVVLAHQENERLVLRVPRLAGSALEEPVHIRLRRPVFTASA